MATRDIDVFRRELVRTNPSSEQLRHLLSEALDVSRPDLIAALLDAGADRDSPPAGEQWGALHRAIEEDLVSIVGLLLERGANPNQPDAFGWTPLLRAIDLAGDATLQTDSKRPSTSVVSLLLEHGANPLLPAIDGATPSSIATKYEFHEALELLSRACVRWRPNEQPIGADRPPLANARKLVSSMSQQWSEPAPPDAKPREQPDVQLILEAARTLRRTLECTVTDDELLALINELLFGRYAYWRHLNERVLMLAETVGAIVDRLFHAVLLHQTESSFAATANWGDLAPDDREKIMTLVESALVAAP